MTNWLKVIRPAALVLAVVLAGCGSLPETHYYTIGRVIPEVPAAARIVPLTVGVPKFEAEGIYERDNLLYRKGEYEIAVDYYRRWGVPPQTMLAEATLDCLRNAGLFSGVLRLPSMSHYDAVLGGRIVRFEEAAGKFEVALEYTLQGAPGNRILWRGEFTSSAPVTVALTPEARVAATEKCIADCLGQLVRALSTANLDLN
jgi:ABC-type uncharacterized transport system auxiliary subunit